MRSFSGTSLAVAALLTLSVLPGCAKVGQLKALKSLKAANAAYKQQDYKAASDLYEETVQADPNQAVAYFYLANSYDQQFKPSKKGEAANDAFLTKAAQNYQTAAEKLSSSDKPEDKKLGKLSLEYLVAVYGQDKLNDPAKAEPVVQHMIQLDPSETTNYFGLAKIYEDAGAYDAAEQMLLKAKEVKPNPSAAAAPGQLKWSFQTDGSFYDAPLVADGAAYTGNMSHSAYAVNLKTGQQKWVVQLGADTWSSPAVSGTTVLITAENRYLYAMDRNSGKPLWKTKIDMPPLNNTPQLSEPIVASGLVVFGSADGMLRAFDIATGQQKWKLIAGSNLVPPHARFANGVLVFASYSQYVGAVNASTGKLLWRKDLGAEFDGLPCIDNGIAYFRTAGVLYALDLKTGEQRWSTDIEAWGGQQQGILPSPAAGDGIVCFPGVGNSLVALDAKTGKQKWTFEAQGPVAPPAVGQGMVCFGSQDSSVYGLDAKTGKQLWKCDVGQPLITQTVLHSGVAYVGGEKNGLFAVQASK